MNNQLPLALKISAWLAFILSFLFLVLIVGVILVLGKLSTLGPGFLLGGWLGLVLLSLLILIFPLTELFLGLSILKKKRRAMVPVSILILLNIGTGINQKGGAQMIDLLVAVVHVFILISLFYHRKLFSSQSYNHY